MDLLEPCPCGSGASFGQCCQPFIAKIAYPATAESLMRSRYTAYVVLDTDYLMTTWHPSTRPRQLELNPAQRWLGLKIKSTSRGNADDHEGAVTFAARYKIDGRGHRLDEHSQFVCEEGRWFYLKGC